MTKRIKRLGNWAALRAFLIGALCAPFAATGALPKVPADLEQATAQRVELQAEQDLEEPEARA